MMDEALLGEQQKNTHYNMADNKHIEKFLTFSVQHRISQSHLHIVLAMLPDLFIFLSLVQSQIVVSVHSAFRQTHQWQIQNTSRFQFKIRKGTGEPHLLNKKTRQPRIMRQKHSQDVKLRTDTQRCSDTVCLHIKMPRERQSRHRAQKRARLWN